MGNAHGAHAVADDGAGCTHHQGSNGGAHKERKNPGVGRKAHAAQGGDGGGGGGPVRGWWKSKVEVPHEGLKQ